MKSECVYVQWTSEQTRGLQFQFVDSTGLMMYLPTDLEAETLLCTKSYVILVIVQH